MEFSGDSEVFVDSWSIGSDDDIAYFEGKCLHHLDRDIDYFCKHHQQFGCSLCIIHAHNNCDNVVYIPAVCENLQTSKEFREFKENLNRLERDIKNSQNYIQTSFEKAESLKANTKIKVEKFRTQINEFLDKLEKEIEIENDKIRRTDQNEIEKYSKQIDKLYLRLKTLASDVENKEKLEAKSQLYIMMKSSALDLHEIEQKLAETRRDEKFVNMVTQFRFAPAPQIVDLMASEVKLGELIRIDDALKVEATFEKAIEPQKSGFRLFSTRAPTKYLHLEKLSGDNVVATTDWSHCSIHLIDIGTKKIKSTLKLGFMAAGISKVREGLIALTDPHGKKIQLVTVSDAFSLAGDIRLYNSCYGLASTSNEFIFTCVEPPKVEIIDMTVAVLKRFQYSIRGQNIFKEPRCIALSPDQEFIYVADTASHSVTCLTIEGDVYGVYRSEFLCEPKDLAVDKQGHVYVCGYNNIHCVSPDCGQGRVMLGNNSEDKLTRCTSVAYCGKENKLYVVNDATMINVYKLG